MKTLPAFACLRSAFSLGVLLGAAPLLHAGTVAEIETPLIFAEATPIHAGDYSLNTNPNVFGSLPTVALTGRTTPANVDIFKFEGSAGALIYADVDNDPHTTLTHLWLFNKDYYLIAYDNLPTDKDFGSASDEDAFLGVFTLPITGTYYLAITNGWMAPQTYFSVTVGPSLLRPDGVASGNLASGGFADTRFFGDAGVEGDYTIFLSNTSVPEPGAWASALGLLSIAAVSRRRK